MSLATLMAPPTAENLPSWQFDHAMAHRQLFGAMSEALAVFDIGGEPVLLPTGGALSGFSALPYVLDPQVNLGSWHQNHGQAHADAQVALPGWFGHLVTTTIGPTPDLTDMDFEDQALLSWWTFSNEQQHIAAQNVLPETLTFPFW